MNKRVQFRHGLALLLFLVSTPLWAGIPSPSAIVGSPSNQGFFSTALGTGSPTHTITLTFYDENQTFYVGSALDSLSISGANATDFAIVGGTCDPGNTQLSSGNPSCTVVIQYTPSTSDSESAQLTGSCTAVPGPGGFTLICNGTSGQLSSLLGSIVAALTPTPLLDPKMLTALSMLVLGIGAYFSSRRKT